MNYDEQAKKVIGLQNPCDEILDKIIQPIINDEKINDSVIMMVMSAYYMGEINGKRDERAKRLKTNNRAGVSKELADFMGLFYQIIEGNTDNMTVGDLYAVKNKYGLSNEEVRQIYAL